MSASPRAADLIDAHRDLIITETLVVLGQRIPFMLGLDEASRRKSAVTIFVGLTHLLRGAPVEALVDVIHGVARQRLEEGMSRAELALVAPIYIIGARRGLHGIPDFDAVMRPVEDAMLRIGDLVNKAILGDLATTGILDKRAPPPGLVEEVADTFDQDGPTDSVPVLPVVPATTREVLPVGDRLPGEDE